MRLRSSAPRARSTEISTGPQSRRVQKAYLGGFSWWRSIGVIEVFRAAAFVAQNSAWRLSPAFPVKPQFREIGLLGRDRKLCGKGGPHSEAAGSWYGIAA